MNLISLQLVKERDELLAQGQQRQSREEDWDKRTETLAKVKQLASLLLYPTNPVFPVQLLVELRRSLD